MGISRSNEEQGVTAGLAPRSTALVVDRPALAWAAQSGMLDGVSPKLAIVAPGSNPREMAANSLVVPTHQVAGARTLETDVEGAVTVEMTNSSFAVRTFRSGTEKLP
jgi:beta-lactamase superfamily II metal-dependent hydrolase